jgi:hypothetical protein
MITTILAATSLVTMPLFEVSSEKSLSPERVLVDAALELRVPVQRSNFFYIETHAGSAMEALQLKSSFKALSKELSRLLHSGDYRQAWTIGNQMFKMLPENYNPKYPLSDDFRSEWKAQLGDLKLYTCDYKGAIAEYEVALAIPPVRKNSMQQGGHSHAAYGIALAYGITGNLKESYRWLEAAPSMYWSGCGNCADGEAAAMHRYKTIWNAANKPADVSEGELLAILKGKFTPRASKINNDEASQVKRARVEASFFLGELYRKQSNKALARRCFWIVVNGNSNGDDTLARMARTRLDQLGS